MQTSQVLFLAAIAAVIVLAETGFNFARRRQAKRSGEDLNFQLKAIANHVDELDSLIAGRMTSVQRGLDESIVRKMAVRHSDQEGIASATARLETMIQKLDLIKTEYANERFVGLEARVALIEMRYSVRNGVRNGKADRRETPPPELDPK